jgi:transposase-like protein
MRNDRDPWHEGRDRWERMRIWLDEGTPAPDGAAGLAALSDLVTQRRLLDLIELAAVRAARREGRSWTEIATRLGVSRQSAWERWRDLDEPSAAESLPGISADAVAEVVAEVVIEHVAEQAGRRRREAKVKVPNVVGRPVPEAIRVLTEAGLLPIGPDPDAPDPLAVARPGSVVTDQSPESGARVAARSWVRLWFSGGNDGGVREPRNPAPDPPRLTATLDLPAGGGIG